MIKLNLKDRVRRTHTETFFELKPSCSEQIISKPSDRIVDTDSIVDQDVIMSSEEHNQPHTVSVKAEDIENKDEIPLTNTVCGPLTVNLTHTVSVKNEVNQPHTVSVKEEDVENKDKITLTHTVCGAVALPHTVSVKAEDVENKDKITLTHTVCDKSDLIPYELRKNEANRHSRNRPISTELIELLSVILAYKIKETSEGILTHKISKKSIVTKIKCSEAAVKQRMEKAVKLGLLIRKEFDKKGTVFFLTHTVCDKLRSSSINTYNISVNSTTLTAATLPAHARVLNDRHFREIETVWKSVLPKHWEADGIDLDLILKLISQGKIRDFGYKKVIDTVEKIYFAKRLNLLFSGRPIESVRSVFLWTVEKNGCFIEISEWQEFQKCLKLANGDKETAEKMLRVQIEQKKQQQKNSKAKGKFGKFQL